MKKVTGLIMFICLLLTTSAVVAAPNLATNSSVKQVVILPYINSTEETKDYIGETINEKFKEQFANDKYQTVSGEQVQSILTADSFDPANKELPDNDLMIKLAKATDADYIIAMEVVHFINSRHVAYFSTSAKSEVKLKYKVYSKAADKVIVFQTTGKGNNKVTSIGVPGIGMAMKRGIIQAMDEAYLRIQKL